MNNKLLLLGTMVAVLCLPALASATHLSNFEGAADCTSWWAGYDIIWAVDEAVLDYSVVLSDAAGAEVVRFDVVGETVLRPADLYTSSYSLGESWGQELCGDYTVSATFTLTADASWREPGTLDITTKTFTTAFTCDCPVDEACHFTPGYWKNHAELWPVLSLVIGGVEYSQDELLAIMDMPVRGDTTIILAYHLIAAMLNVANGADRDMDQVIIDANDYLAINAIGSHPSRGVKAYGIDLKDLLGDWNEMGCPGQVYGEDDADKSFESDSEPVSWDQLKAQYR